MTKSLLGLMLIFGLSSCNKSNYKHSYNIEIESVKGCVDTIYVDNIYSSENLILSPELTLIKGTSWTREYSKTPNLIVWTGSETLLLATEVKKFRVLSSEIIEITK